MNWGKKIEEARHREELARRKYDLNPTYTNECDYIGRQKETRIIERSRR